MLGEEKIMKNLYRQEILFPSAMAEVINKEYGMLFYNKACPLSHDTNHAVITNLNCDIDIALNDITSFYNSREIVPRVYFGFVPGELDVLKPFLERHGYELGIYNGNSFFIHKNISTATPLKNMKFKRLLAPELGIEELIRSGEDEVQEVKESGVDGEWWVTFLYNTIKVEHIHMLVGYINDKPVTIASVNIMDGYSRIDDVKTHTDFWNRGYSSAMMDYLAKYHAKLSDNVLYLYASNPAAIRVYEKVGFVKVENTLPMWSAY